MNTMMWLSIIWIAPLMCFMLTNERKVKKNLVVGVTLPFAAREDAEVKAIQGRFKKAEWIVCALLVVIAAVGWLLIKDVTETMALWMVWIDLCIILPYVPYVRTNSALKKLKKERGWGMPEGHRQIRVDMSAIPQGKWISAWAFVPAGVLCFVSLLFDRSMWVMNVIMGVCVVLFWFGYRYCYRNKSEMVDGDVELTRVLTQVRRQNWGKMWLLAAYSMAILTLAVPLTMHSAVLSIAVYVIFTVVLVAASLWVELSTRRIQERLTAESGRDWYVDEDDYWIGGILYYNTNDSRLIINNRVGLNSTVNVAHPAGKILTVLLVVMLACMPLSGSFIGGGELVLTASDDAVSGINGRTEYVIPLEDVASVELLEELPGSMHRNFGTGLPNLLKGDFTSRELGHMKVCLDPTAPPFVLVETKEGNLYLLGSREEGAAESVYKEINR